jgi:hypothetical protein
MTIGFDPNYCSFFQKNKSYGVKKPFALILCLLLLNITSRTIYSPSLQHLPEESRTSQARMTSRRTGQGRVVKDKPGKASFGSSRVRDNTQYCQREQALWQWTKIF